MRTTQWKPATTVVEQLLERPYRFEFAQAVRIARAWLNRFVPDAATRKHPTVWFRHRTSLAFPASEVDAVDLEHVAATQASHTDSTGDLKRISITPSFGSMLGVSGYLPYHYTEELLELDLRTGPDGQTGFFELLSQRATLLHHDAWEKCRVYPAAVTQCDEDLHKIQLALAGVPRAANNTPSGCANSTQMTLFAAFYAGVLRHHATSPQVLQNVLSEYFDVPFQVQPFIGTWRALDQDERVRVGDGCTLDTGLLLGPRGYDRTDRVRLRIGPLSLDQYERFLPRTEGAAALAQIVGMFRVAALSFEVQLVLRAADVPQVVLRRTNRPGTALGYVASISTHAIASRDHDVLHYELNAHFAEKPDGRL